MQRVAPVAVEGRELTRWQKSTLECVWFHPSAAHWWTANRASGRCASCDASSAIGQLMRESSKAAAVHAAPLVDCPHSARCVFGPQSSGARTRPTQRHQAAGCHDRIRLIRRSWTASSPSGGGGSSSSSSSSSSTLSRNSTRLKLPMAPTVIFGTHIEMRTCVRALSPESGSIGRCARC